MAQSLLATWITNTDLWWPGGRARLVSIILWYCSGFCWQLVSTLDIFRQTVWCGGGRQRKAKGFTNIASVGRVKIRSPTCTTTDRRGSELKVWRPEVRTVGVTVAAGVAVAVAAWAEGEAGLAGAEEVEV